MNLAAADVTPLILHGSSLSRLTSAATNPKWFLVPTRATYDMEAHYEHGLSPVQFAPNAHQSERR